MAKAYHDSGVPVSVVEISEDQEATKNRLSAALSGEKPLFALGINGIGQFSLGSGSIYDAGHIPHVSWLVDHPAYHMSRIEAMPKKFGILALVDQDHDAFVEASIPQAIGTLFLPHGGCAAKETFISQRDLDLVFCGTGASPDALRSEWINFPEPHVACLKAGIEIGSPHPRRPLMDVVTQAFTDLQLRPDRAMYLKVMLQIERYLRAQDRYAALKALDEANIAVDIFGAGWGFASFRNHRVHGSLDFEQTLQLFKRSKMALNVSWFFTSGAHERVFSAMLNGCVAVTHSSRYLNSLPGFRESACIYDDTQSLVDSVRSLLSNEQTIREMGKIGAHFTENGHTFKHRAEDLRHSIINALSA